MKRNSIQAWVCALRPKTLTGACIPVLVASALAFAEGELKWLPAIICLIYASLMQISANLINDLYDYLKGSDRSDRLGPERACAQGWISVGAMKCGIVVVIIFACVTGCLLLQFGNPLFLVTLGVGCVLFAFLYTLLLSYCGLGDVLVLVFFGLVPVLGTHYVETGRTSSECVLTAFICGVLIDTLLVLNNYRDRDTDRRDGKRTLIARFGEPFGRYLYLGLGIVAYALCLFYLCKGRVAASVLPAFYLPLHVMTWREMVKIRQGRALNGILGKTSRNMIVFALLLAAGLAWG